jgi:hypothetical protein
MDRLAEVDNLQNYSEEIVDELKQLLLLGGLALPDPERKGFYDLETFARTFFIHISSITGPSPAECFYSQHGSALPLIFRVTHKPAVLRRRCSQADGLKGARTYAESPLVNP